MDYRLELLSEDNFENLINRICQEVLGTGVISFSKGKDGGRDGIGEYRILNNLSVGLKTTFTPFFNTHSVVPNCSFLLTFLIDYIVLFLPEWLS